MLRSSMLVKHLPASTHDTNLAPAIEPPRGHDRSFSKKGVSEK